MIEIKNCTVTYAAEPNHRALKDVNLTINDGEFVLLTGESGCGKTTIIRLINGLIPYFYDATVQGDVYVDGLHTSESSIYDLAKKSGTVFQNPRSQFYTCEVKSELVFGCENEGIPEDEILKRLDETVKRFSVDKLLERGMFELSGGEKQQIACASIDMEKTKIILLDEPSANLDYEAINRLKELISIWKKEGKTIIASEHRIAYLWEMCDRTIVIEDGRIIRNLDKDEMKQVTEDEIRSFGIRSYVDRNPFEVDIPEATDKDNILRFENYRFKYKKGDRVFTADDVKIAKGEITALIGYNGAGKTTFLNCLCGIRKCEGDLVIDGDVYGRKQRKKKMFMIMQDVSHQLFTESVLDEVLLGMEEEDREAALEILKKLDLDMTEARHPLSLSGGQMQRVAIASALAGDNDIILLDEPTSGLDYKHMMDISDILKNLQSMGKTIIVATHDGEFIESCCSRKIII
ncbi:MAG: ABC transporter ATP-binding protein [Pseudobutyrivibrio sp.]|uniref:ABC transporter ATP-binding protein n=1 Tax=Pseudobutyrivibrio sp. TaxID=2014367 RepID=UPI0025F0B575|nr:ABC transporter ATP-binding protein [Pseudobutyrivibrio sp.]MBE5903203.1 ABC transporter ATP-binding protein [Pseudobutyrivibrio sp.]